jgi:hypothetical protein
MKSVTLEVNDETETQLSLFSERCDTTPGQFLDLLCESLDRETLERVVERAIRDDSMTSTPGVARMPERRVAAMSRQDVE